jgi:opine dehydrogenase
MGNVGAILHPAPLLFNVGWIETLRTQFLHYYEGITQSVGAFLEQMDQERIAVARALGVETPSVKQWLDDVYGARGRTLHNAILSNEAYREIYAPQTIHHRYIYEDTPTGLVPMTSFGRAMGVDTPCLDLIIDLATALCGVDFRAQGRSIESLGLAGLDRQGLHHFVTDAPIW